MGSKHIDGSNQRMEVGVSGVAGTCDVTLAASEWKWLCSNFVTKQFTISITAILGTIEAPLTGTTHKAIMAFT